MTLQHQYSAELHLKCFFNYTFLLFTVQCAVPALTAPALYTDQTILTMWFIQCISYLMAHYCQLLLWDLLTDLNV